MARTALVIDDDKMLCEIIKKMLEARDFTVDTTNDGKTGLTMALNNSYSLVVSDVIMPEKEGVAVLREIKKKVPDQKVFITSGAGDKEQYLVTAKEFGADAILVKPVRRAEFDIALNMAGF